MRLDLFQNSAEIGARCTLPNVGFATTPTLLFAIHVVIQPFQSNNSFLIALETPIMSLVLHELRIKSCQRCTDKQHSRREPEPAQAREAGLVLLNHLFRPCIGIERADVDAISTLPSPESSISVITKAISTATSSFSFSPAHRAYNRLFLRSILHMLERCAGPSWPSAELMRLPTVT